MWCRKLYTMESLSSYKCLLSNIVFTCTLVKKINTSYLQVDDAVPKIQQVINCSPCVQKPVVLFHLCMYFFFTLFPKPLSLPLPPFSSKSLPVITLSTGQSIIIEVLLSISGTSHIRHLCKMYFGSCAISHDYQSKRNVYCNQSRICKTFISFCLFLT